MLLVSLREIAFDGYHDVQRRFATGGVFRWVWVNEAPSQDSGKASLHKMLYTCGQKLMPIVLLKGSRGYARGLAFHEWQSSNRKAQSCSLSRRGHRVHAMRGCPPSRSVCLSCWLGTVVWAFCLQERGQQPVSSSCCKNRVGKPERSFHSRTYYPGKNPARTNKPFLMKDHLHSDTALQVRT